MIILKLSEESLNQKKVKIKRWKKPKEQLFNYSRSGIVIDNKPHFVITVTEKTLEDIEFLRLLYKYKGCVIVPENLEDKPELSGLLFDSKPYMKSAVFENFKTMLLSGEYKDATVLIEDSDFLLSAEIPDLLPYVKNITIKTSGKQNLREWQEKCFFEYGIKPSVICEEGSVCLNFDIIANFEQVERGFLEISVYNEIKRIYPEFKFLQIPDELKILEGFGISNKMICAAFKK